MVIARQLQYMQKRVRMSPATSKKNWIIKLGLKKSHHIHYSLS